MIVSGTYRGRPVSIRLVDGAVNAPGDVRVAYDNAVASGFAYLDPATATTTPGERTPWDFFITAASVLDPGSVRALPPERPDVLPGGVDI